MDVVKSSIESLGGTLSIFSEINMGTTFRLELPLTSAIIKVFVVETGGGQYGIPCFEIESVFELGESKITPDNKLEYRQFLDSDPETLDMLNLGELLNPRLKKGNDNFGAGVILKIGTERKALLVEKLCGVEEVIIKPLSAVLKFISGISGVTILPTGRPMFILNLSEIIH